MANILLVEDEIQLQKAYSIILSSAGHTVQEANDGQEALNKLKAFHPDLILLDISMPNMDGLQFLKQYNQSYTENNKPEIVVFSNMDHANLLDKAYKLGVTRYILKSATSPKELLILVDKVLGNKKSP
jgi:CheY-like chemotaxis protein